MPQINPKIEPEKRELTGFVDSNNIEIGVRDIVTLVGGVIEGVVKSYNSSGKVKVKWGAKDISWHDSSKLEIKKQYNKKTGERIPVLEGSSSIKYLSDISRLKKLINTEVNVGDVISEIVEDDSINPIKRQRYTRILKGINSDDERYQEIDESTLSYLLEKTSNLRTEVPSYVDNKELGRLINKILPEAEFSDPVYEESTELFNKLFHEIKQVYPSMNLSDIDTWDVYDGEEFVQLQRIVGQVWEKQKELESESEKGFSLEKHRKRLEDIQKVGEADLVDQVRNIVFDVLDNTSIELAYAMIFDDLKKYTQSMREKVYNWLIDNQNSKEWDVIVGSKIREKQVDTVTDDTLQEYFDNDTVVDILRSGQDVILRQGEDGKVYVVIKKGAEFEIHEGEGINEARFTPRDEMLELIEKKFPDIWVKPGEEFDSDYEGSIWTGEGSYVEDEDSGIALDAYNPHAAEGPYTFGLHDDFYNFLEEHGWGDVAHYDSGTVFIYPEYSGTLPTE